MAAKKPATKKVTKQIKSLKKNLEKEKKATTTVKKKLGKMTIKDAQHDRELELLKKEVEMLKKRKRTSRLSAYQKFMSAQIKKGKTFKEAAALWRKMKKAEELKLKKSHRSAYNIFISVQLKRGRTMKQAIAAWRELQHPRKRRKVKPKIITKTRTRTKIKVVRVKSKPKVITKTRTRTKVRVVRVKAKPKIVRIKSKPKVITKTETKVVEKEVFPAEKFKEIISQFNKVQKVSVHGPVFEEDLSDEELALRMVKLYFKEIAQLGYKASLDLDKVINAYLYSLSRVQRRDIEISRIAEALKESRLRRKM